MPHTVLKRCSFNWCPNSEMSASMQSIPADSSGLDDVRKKWIRFIQESYVDEIWEPPDSGGYLCSKHFSADDFDEEEGIGCLREDAVPSIGVEEMETENNRQEDETEEDASTDCVDGGSTHNNDDDESLGMDIEDDTVAVSEEQENLDDEEHETMDEDKDEEDLENFSEHNHEELNDEEDEGEDDDPNEEQYADYSCDICEEIFTQLNDLFKHLESHDSDEYAFTSEEPQCSKSLLGDADEEEQPRKWPSRFLKFPSEVFQTLSYFSSLKPDDEEDDFEDIGDSPTEFYNGDNKSEPTSKLNGTASKPRSQEQISTSAKKTKLTVARRGSFVGNFLALAKRSKKFPFSRRRYKCPYCANKDFCRSDHYRQHLANHTGHRPFVCKLCGKRFSVSITLRRHMGTHAAYKPYKCSKCPRRFNQSGHLKRHEESPFTHTEAYMKMDYRRRCRLCFEMFPNDNTRLEHETRVHHIDNPTAVLRCRYTSCRLIHSDLKHLVEHYKRNHSNERLVLRDEESTELPDNSAENEDTENEDINSYDEESPSLPLPIPTQAATSEECRMCFQYFVTLSDRNYHERIVHDINNPATVLECKYKDCRKILGAKNWLARHIREHRRQGHEDGDHPPLQEENFNDEDFFQAENGDVSSESEMETENYYDCRVCDDRFPEEHERSAHEVLHNISDPDASFRCKFCSVQLGNFSALVLHTERHHENNNSDVSPIAGTGKGGKSQSKYVFTCRHCDDTFSDQHQRLNHEYDVHGTRDALGVIYPCKICGKSMTLRGLRKHIRRIHGQNPVPDYSQSQEASEEDPPKEEVEKFPPQPAKVPIPPTPIQIVLIEPSKSKSRRQTPPTSTNVVYKRSSEPSSASWVCRLCFDQFDEQRQRENHEHTIHGTNSVNATFVCKYEECQEEFGAFRSLIKHLRQHGETTVPTNQQKLPSATLTQYKPTTPTTSTPAVLPNDTNDTLIWRCRLCWEVFPSQQHRLSHEYQLHQTNDKSITLLCKWCPKTFTTMKQLIRHLDTHGEGRHSLDIETNDSPAEFSQGPSDSPHGGADSPPPILEAQVTPPKSSPVTCRLCPLVLTHVKARIDHENKVHHTKNMRKEQLCKICGASLSNFRQLLIHFKSSHKTGLEKNLVKNDV